MRMLLMLLLLLTSISLIGCSSVRGNVVPQTGPTMEQVYDSMSVTQSSANPVAINSLSGDGEADLPEIRRKINTVEKYGSGTDASVGQNGQNTDGKNGFRKLPNPELTMIVFPHLAGDAEIPIPGYSTVFNAYERDHYALPQETPRD